MKKKRFGNAIFHMWQYGIIIYARIRNKIPKINPVAQVDFIPVLFFRSLV
jgi:hypothetical protein